MPLARDLHPEFGYVGSAPRLCRKLGLGLAFVAFGLAAAASGLSVFMAAPEPDPTQAMALAPADALVSDKFSRSPNAPERIGRTHSASEQKADKWEERDKTAAIKPLCRGGGTEQPGGCTFVRSMKARPAPALNERPPIAAVPIGHRDEPAILPSAEPPVSVAAIPQPEEASAAPETPPEAAASPAPVPVPAAKKARARPQHSQRREAYAPSHNSYGYRSTPSVGGYAGVY